jgi:glycosyltransferase involved in cell wall biosynthesis
VSRPHKILHVITSLEVGGAETTLARVVTSRPSLADETIVVSLLPHGVLTPSLQDAGIEVLELDFSSPIGIGKGLARLVGAIRSRRPDIVQGWMYHGDIVAWLALALSGQRARTRLVWSIRCSDLDFRHYSRRLRLIVRACAILSGRPDVVTANSAAGMRSHRALGYRPRRSEVLPNGVDTVAFKPDADARAAARRELGIAEDPILLAHVARVDPMKDHAGFLATMATLPDLQALLVGLGTDLLTPAPNLHLLGRRANVARLFAAADFVVSSSAFGEGFSNVLAEGMACGLPAIATDVGDARLIVGDTGLVVPPRNPSALATAIRTLAAEPVEHRRQRSARARAWIASQFSIAQGQQRFAALYASLFATVAKEQDP